MYKKLQEIIDNSNNIVFFGGAGVSTESGIPDFRSVDGLYNQKYDFPPETILSRTFFDSHTEEFYKFYRDKMIISDSVKPNSAHLKLAELEKFGKLSCVITQNIDGLHYTAGSKKVYELHGSIHQNHCMRCKKSYPLSFIANSKGVPICDCGGVIKPDVVLYEESLNENVLENSVYRISKADTIIVAGTSLSVYPAAGLLRYFKGENIILINLSKTPYDDKATLVINEKIGEVFSKINI